MNRWLATGARLSYGTGPVSPSGGDGATTFGIVGDVTLTDGSGTRTLARGATLNPANGRAEQTTDAAIEAEAGGDAGVVYVRRANGAVERFGAVGRAADQGWASSPDVRLVQRRFPAPTQAQRRVTPLLGPGAQVYRAPTARCHCSSPSPTAHPPCKLLRNSRLVLFERRA